MNDIKKQGDIWYFDSNVLQGLNKTDFDKLLLFCKQNSALTFYVSEIVLWECGCKYQENRDNADVFPKKSQLEINRLAELLAGYKLRFEEYDFKIIPVNQAIYDEGNKLIKNDDKDNKKSFFSTNNNNKRDAYICATALLELPNNCIIFVDEKKVQDFLKNKFEIKNVTELKQILENKDKSPPIKIDSDNISDHNILETFTEHAHKIFCDYNNDRYAIYKPQWEQAEKNLRLQEQEKNRSFEELESIKPNGNELSQLHSDNRNILDRVLGYMGFFDTIEKQKLFIFLQSYGYVDSKINTQIQNAISEHFVIETDNYFIANNNNIESKTILNQAMDSIMPELLEKLDLA